MAWAWWVFSRQLAVLFTCQHDTGRSDKRDPLVAIQEHSYESLSNSLIY
eukprot:COSAG06_NODE_1886_length_8141_cov_76.884709_6_plen_49_part_00